ncbi:MAG: hypothetical protein IJZ20_04665 [Clostridia bacterium]|nr:hypothetical protein [Clostridia bacterium]
MEILKEKAEIGAAMDIKAKGNYLYAIQNGSQHHGGRLCVLNKDDLSLAASYEGIGNARQIEIVGNTAVVTAREDGLFLFDISDTVPLLLCHYRTVEFATGVALWKSFAFISCRQYGVEVIDIRNPQKPLHICLIRCGEVQSATVSEGFLYCGVWGKMQVVIFDIRDLSNPVKATEIPLNGRGDGVHVKDGILYAATGQHARGIVNTADENDPCFGMGNGVEVYDVTNPYEPKKLKETRFEKAHCLSFDMWEAAIYGDTLVVNNSVLGVYGLEPDTLETKFRLMPPAVSDKSDAVTGVTSAGGDIFVATACGGVFAYRNLRIGDELPNTTGDCPAIKPHPFKYDGFGATAKVVYSGIFPVLSATVIGDYIALALCEDGVHLLDKETLSLKFKITTKGKAQDVKAYGNVLFVAEEASGIEAFAICDGKVEKISEIAFDRQAYQLAVSKSGRYLLCICGSTDLHMLNVSDIGNIKELYGYKTRHPLYGNNLAENCLSDGTMVLFCHRTGLVFTNPDCGDREFHTVEYTAKVNFCGYCAGHGIETDGEHIFYTRDGGLAVISHKDADKTPIESVPFHKDEKAFNGLLTICNGILAASSRFDGKIYIVDLKDIEAPKIIAKLATNASPSKAVFTDKRMLVPCGRMGLVELKL